MEKGQLLYSGKAKELYATEDEQILWVDFIDQATALNGLKKDIVAGKGELNCAVSTIIYKRLEAAGIETAMIATISKTTQLQKRVEIIPLEVVLRNVVAGSFAKRFGLEEGAKLVEPIVEFYYKDDDLDDPFVNDEHVKYLGIANDAEIVYLKAEVRKINEILKQIFSEVDLTLVDYKVEFGRTADGKIILADEISQDCMRLWDKDGNHIDKDVYRRDLGDLLTVYKELLARLQAANPE